MEVYLVIHLAMGALAYAGMFAYSQREWPGLAEEGYWRDIIYYGSVCLLTGPIGMIAAAIVTRGFSHGFKWK